MQNLWIIPALPFIGFLINGIFGRKLPKSVINLIAVGSVVLSFAWVLKVFMTAGDWGANPVTSTISPGSRAASSTSAGISRSTS
jgi:NADH:ubiquinone oxidoreductase subunit 5 (subunit L)/multisubunit Na+/H+ antiporter MnhA subunit